MKYHVVLPHPTLRMNHPSGQYAHTMLLPPVQGARLV